MDARFKLIFLFAVLFMTSLPIVGILKGTDPPPSDPGGGTGSPLPNGKSLPVERKNGAQSNKRGNGFDPRRELCSGDTIRGI